MWIDVCQNDGNLLVAAGSEKHIKIYDRRESQIVRTFEEVHSETINCVRWNSIGDMLCSASYDSTVKLLDLKTGKVVLTEVTADKSKLKYYFDEKDNSLKIAKVKDYCRTKCILNLIFISVFIRYLFDIWTKKK